jgi:hypothetical protein
MTPLLAPPSILYQYVFKCAQPNDLFKQMKQTGKQIKSIENNIALVAKLKDYNLPVKEFFVLKPKKEMN